MKMHDRKNPYTHTQASDENTIDGVDKKLLQMVSVTFAVLWVSFGDVKTVVKAMRYFFLK